MAVRTADAQVKARSEIGDRCYGDRGERRRGRCAHHQQLDEAAAEDQLREAVMKVLARPPVRARLQVDMMWASALAGLFVLDIDRRRERIRRAAGSPLHARRFLSGNGHRPQSPENTTWAGGMPEAHTYSRWAYSGNLDPWPV